VTERGTSRARSLSGRCFHRRSVEEQLDFSTYERSSRYCLGKEYDVVIHAGRTNKFNRMSIRIHRIRTSSGPFLRYCIVGNEPSRRLVYISSDYVYPAETGNLHGRSVLLPVNRYANRSWGRDGRAVGITTACYPDSSCSVRKARFPERSLPRSSCTSDPDSAGRSHRDALWQKDLTAHYQTGAVRISGCRYTKCTAISPPSFDFA